MKNLTASNPVRSLITRAGIFAITAVAGLLGAAAPAQAQQVYYFASTDWRHWFHNWDDNFHIDTVVDEMFVMTDRMGFGMPLPGGGGFSSFHGGGVAFFTSGANGIADGIVQVTTVYGIDLTPGAPQVSLTGFDPLNPQLVPLSGETIYSRFGTTYESVASLTLPLSNIGSILPGHDLSWFAGGDPGSTLYAFQTYAPLDEFLAPAPGSLALLGLGGVLAVRRRR
ncbi:hypothetical protein PHYC_02522 [Phycisphaerales bacterium]|nr:hypothetical protein PHYC_02522 [Phycisphaerales bacterium]